MKCISLALLVALTLSAIVATKLNLNTVAESLLLLSALGWIIVLAIFHAQAKTKFWEENAARLFPNSSKGIPKD
ncbi:hypothetical protein JNK13_01865 [bacterium]|nr:hypothetical protein [bacterium]